MKKLKKMIGILLAGVLSLGTITAYADEPEKMWYDDIVNELLEQKIINNADNLEAYLTRGDVIEILVDTKLFNEEGLPAVTDEAIFSDLDKSHPNYEDVYLLYAKGIFCGTRDKHGKVIVNLDEYLTREQAAVFLTRAFGLRSDGSSSWGKVFDCVGISSYARKSVKECYEHQVISWEEFTTYRPLDKMQKAEFLEMLYKTIKLHDVYKEAFYAGAPEICEDMEFQGEVDVETQTAKITLKNTSTAFYVFPEAYSLEVMRNGEKIVIEGKQLEEGYSTYYINVGEKRLLNVELKRYFGELETGEYKLVAEVFPHYLTDLKQKVIFEFTLE